MTVTTLLGQGTGDRMGIGHGREVALFAVCTAVFYTCKHSKDLRLFNFLNTEKRGDMMYVFSIFYKSIKHSTARCLRFSHASGACY